MSDYWRLSAVSITKYDPRYRDAKGYYKKDEWSDFSEVGQVVAGELLSFETYKATEEKYIKAAILFFQFHECDTIVLKRVEKYSVDGYVYDDREELLELYETIRDGIKIKASGMPSYLKLILRGLLWGELHCEKSPDVAVRFGYDYYMYFNFNGNMEPLFAEIRTWGLFVN